MHAATNRETWAEFIARNGITLTAKTTAKNPDMPNSDNMHHWRVTLHRGEKGVDYNTMCLTFSMGAALNGPPEADDVLDCLASDSNGIENSKDFNEWCAELGYDTDSRKAEKTYKACQRQADAFKAFLGAIEYHRALWGTEAL